MSSILPKPPDKLVNFKIPKKKQESPNDKMINPMNYYYAEYSSPEVVAGISDPITQRVWSTLTQCTEKPKNLKAAIIDEDDSLPSELRLLFQPLYCKLCSVQLSSSIMAKLHYKSKNHDKKVRKFLVEYSERTGEPLHKRARLGNAKTNEDEDPRYFHCETCDLPLTGKMHAESHYMGKNHLKVLFGKKHPAGKGYYNEEGKWIRIPQSKKPELNEDFAQGLKTSDKSPNSQSKFSCDICKVAATCQTQLDMHFKGQKHKKKLRQMGIVFDSSPESLSLGSDSLSSYRTPSGKYYCQSCNLTLNSEAQFKVHLNSKNHGRKISSSKT